jgi:hypothetical protein
MNPLPANICRHPDGLLVRVQRQGVRVQGFIAGHDAAALQRAVALRDRFLALSGGVRVLSNTGIRGISETVRWYHSRPYDAFAVRWPGKPRKSRVFTFQSWGGRRRALRAAVALRKRQTGEIITARQIEEALNHV